MTLASRDRDQLQLLSIFHNVVAFVTAVFGCLPLVYRLVGFAASSARHGTSIHDPAPPIFTSGSSGLALAATSYGLFAWTLAVLLVLSSRALRARRNYALCLVTACLCLFMLPFGTMLGVITLNVLRRESVRAEFGRP